MPILNPHNDPYLSFAENEARQGKRQFSPWTSEDPELLHIAQTYFPQIPIVPVHLLQPPDMTAVEILALNKLPTLASPPPQKQMIAVGGPPAATVALESSLQGKSVLYVSDLDQHSDGKISRPIWAGAGNHGEPDSLTEGPAYMRGDYPLQFILKEILRLFRPEAYDSSVLHPDFSWLSLNWLEWLRHPREWLAAFRIVWGNHQLAKAYTQAIQAGKMPEILEEMQKRTKNSGEYLNRLNQRLKLLREPRGSLLIAASAKQEQDLLRQYQSLLQKQDHTLKPLRPEEVEEKYGFLPRQGSYFMEKAADFIFEPDFLQKITREIQKSGGEVKTNWRLKRVFLDPDKSKGGILEFCELNHSQNISHYRAFSQAHLSLGPTPFSPSVYDLLSVTGVSMNALIIGADLKGGPVVCGGSNHLVPLMAPQVIEMKDPLSGKVQPFNITFARLSAAGCVNPLNRGSAWYNYDGRQAIHLLHHIRKTLPQNWLVKLLSVSGCNRVIGKDGRQIELHPFIKFNHKKIICEQVTIQIGAGGGGLTQMGVVPKKMQEESTNALSNSFK